MGSSQRLRIAFREVARPITQPETKFGGSPVWVDGPQWPLSRRLGGPMHFIGQVALDRRIFPNVIARMAYIFITHDERADETWDPNAGENAVILQPGITSVPHAPLYTGPSVESPVDYAATGESVLRPAEYATDLTLESEPSYIPRRQQAVWTPEERLRHRLAQGSHKIGGSPVFIQGDEFPFTDWRLLLQLDGGCRLPFFVNFGHSGSAWAFANDDLTQAKFLWQC